MGNEIEVKREWNKKQADMKDCLGERACKAKFGNIDQGKRRKDQERKSVKYEPLMSIREIESESETR